MMLPRVQSNKQFAWRPNLVTLLVVGVPAFIFFTAMLGGTAGIDSMKWGIKSSTSSETSDYHRVHYILLPGQSNQRVHRYAAWVEDTTASKPETLIPLTIEKWAQFMASDDLAASIDFAGSITAILKHESNFYRGFRFETKGCQPNNFRDKQFEFALVNDTDLATFAQSADDSYFAPQFDAQNPTTTTTTTITSNNDKSKAQNPAGVITFPNLGRDAILIVPTPLGTTEAISRTYGHLANFIREAPQWQIAATWRLVAEQYLQRMKVLQEHDNNESVWLSTAGNGVPWLHFRLDSRPKYYHYKPFAEET